MNASTKMTPSVRRVTLPASRAGSRLRLSSMITKRKSTMIAPAYTTMCTVATNGAFNKTKKPAKAKSVTIKKIAL